MTLVNAGPRFLERYTGALILFALGLLLWLLNHPYQGIWHDARIYGLLAAHWLHPEALANDLFFRFGSQGDLSLFTPLYGMSVGWLGLQRAAWWLAVSGGVAWVVATMMLAKPMLGTGTAASVAVLLFAIMTVSYSPNQSTFMLTESFGTARSWALPLGLVSVAMLAARRRAWALLPAVASLLLHPLLGIWPLALCVMVWLRLRSAVALALLVVFASIVVGLVNPDLPYLRLMSGDWLSFARDSAEDVVFKASQNRLADYGAALLCLLLGARWGALHARPLYQRALLLSVAGLVMAMLASFWWPVEILVQVQPWRVCWLLLPLALIALLDVSQRLCTVSRAGPAIIGLAGAVVTSGANLWLPALYLLGCSVMVPVARLQQLDVLLDRWRKPLGVAAGLLWLMLLPGIFADWDLVGGKMLQPWWTGAEWLHGLVAGGTWHSAVLLGFTAAWRPTWMTAIPRLVVLAVLALSIVFVLSIWDRQPEFRRTEASCYLNESCPLHVFRHLITPGETVFWSERELSIWFDLNRASYYGDIERTGVVFSREKFDEWKRRDALVGESRRPEYLCADPVLDWVVLPDVLTGVAPRAVASGSYLYACTDLRAVLPAPTFSGVRPITR